MNPLSLSASLTSAFEAAFLAVGVSSSYRPPLQPKYQPPPFAHSGLPPATPIAVRRHEVKAETKEPESPRMADRVREHLSYLREVSRGLAVLITPETAQQAAEAWLDCWEATGYALPVPAACTGPDGQMQYTWDRGDHHLELNISPAEPASFFYRNWETGELWIEEYAPSELPPEACEKLKLFV